MSHSSPIACPDFQRSRLTRRSFLRVGSLGLGGLSLPNLLAAERNSRRSPGKAKAKNVILLFQFGGPSQLDTFDPKPNAPAEIRGEFKTIKTRTPGLLVTEHLPQLAVRSNLYTVVRTVAHRNSSHNPGAYYSLTGREPLNASVTANAAATDFPHPGSIASHLLGSPGNVPASVSLPHMTADGPFRTPGQFAGFLGKAHDPLWVLKDPNDPGFRADELALPDGVSVGRLGERKAIQNGLAGLGGLGDEPAVKGLSDYQARAMDLLSSQATRQAFAIGEEKPATRDRYGRHTYGQSVLLARRLIEAGVRFVTVYYSRNIGGWDTHKDNFSTLKNSRLPHTDGSVSALLDDLRDRGLLDETLVYWMGDFGRTPKINSEAGRDHWPACQSVLMAGGGVRGGAVYGTSDASAAYPKDDPLRPDDVTATVFHALGLDPATEIRDQLARPMPIAAGRPIPIFG